MTPNVEGIDRVDALAKVTGRAGYVGDVDLPRTTHAVLVLSTIARGRIADIDVSAASRSDGVLLIMTHLNAPRLPEEGRAAVKPPSGRVMSLLQDDEVHYNRQPIALVVAETLDKATAAAARVRIAYHEETARLDFRAGKASAHSPGAVNQEPADSERGAPDRRAGTAGTSIAESYTTPMQHHNPMEPHATVAHWQGDRLTVHDTTQFISGTRQTLARTLGVPEANVRILCPYVGGGFGCKGSVWSHVPLTAMAARQLGRPVKLVLERPQMFGMVGGRPQTDQQIRLSADNDGRLVDTTHAVFSHTSALEDFTEPAALQTRILYSCPNLRTTHRLVPLDVGTPTFQRAPGHATGTFAIESAIDELAQALAIDPIELRLRNEPPRDPHSLLPWSGRSLRQCFETGAATFGWSGRNPRPGSMRDGGVLLGWGVATATYPANRQGAHARASLLPDGTALVQSGTQDLGTGTYTVMTQIAAQTLGLPVERVRVELGDSLLPEAPVSGGSQTVASVAPAVQAAAQSLREKLIGLAVADAASPVHGARTADVELVNGTLGLAGRTHREPLAALVARHGGTPVVATAQAAPGPEKKQYSMHSFGAVFAEVRIDEELRDLRVARVVARYDIGRLMNAKTGRSQLLGGIIWGIGMALMEQSVPDPRNGRIVNANLSEYHVPTNADIGAIDVGVIAGDDPHINPLGARGIGEIGITGVAAAIANAAYHATGVRVRDLPVTVDRLLV